MRPPDRRGRPRDRLLPRSVLGLTALFVAAAVGAAFSGTVLYAYYDYRLGHTESAFARYKDGFDKTVKNAQRQLDAQRDNAKAQVKKELEPLQKVAAEGNKLESLVKSAAPSLWFVHTQDEAGQPSVGSAFVVASDTEQTFLLTSFATVRAATRQPGPDVMVRHGGDADIKATLWTWQEDHDLALLIIQKGSQPKLSWAHDTSALRTGDRIFAVSGLGAQGAAISQGFVADVFRAGIQHDAAIGPAFQGGPLLNGDGEVVGVASRVYAPLGFQSDGVYFGVPIQASCDRVLKCPNGVSAGPGGPGSPSDKTKP
ncbi:MAG: trypsin-like peptidase domain-containing protein [Acidimicrobiales bacterium]